MVQLIRPPLRGNVEGADGVYFVAEELAADRLVIAG
jgi:hypothetical protein